MAKNSKQNRQNKGTLSSRDTQLISKVVKRQESITRKDIADWKKARLQATSTYEPKQVLLQRLYDEIMLDALMTSQISVLRVGKSQASSFVLKKGKKVDQEATDKLEDSGLYEDLVEFIVEAPFFGHSLIEFDYEDGNLEADVVPRENISPEVGRYYPDALGTESVLYHELPEFRKWIVEVYPRKRDLGLLNKAVPYVLIKRFALSCWSELCEIFGIPPRVMKTNTTDQGMLDRAEVMMREIGSAAYFIIDSTEEFEFAQGVTTNGDVYKNIIATCDQQLSLLNLAAVVGQDTINGNRSKEESSSKLVDAVIKSDKRLIESTFNKKILPALAKIGFIKEGLKLEIVKEVDIEKLWKMVSEASKHYDFDIAWLKETFGLEIIGIKQAKQKPGDDPNNPDDDNEDQDNKPGDDKEERGFFLNAPESGAFNGNALTEFNDRLIDRVAKGVSTYWDAELFDYISSNLLNAIRTSFKSTLKSVEYNAPDGVYTSAMEQNVFHFSASKTLAEVQELNQAFRESKSYNDFKGKATNIVGKFNDRWQKTEYRTAESVASSSSQYRRLKSQEKLFPIWVYTTVGDGKVRPEHVALEGLALPSNDPRWNKIFPPNDWGDRCVVEPIMKDEHEGGFAEARKQVDTFFESSIWKKATAQGWGVNRALSAEVFTQNQMYIKKFPTKAKKLVGELYYNDYGLDSLSKVKAGAKTVLNEFKGNPSEWYAKNDVFTDFSNKTIRLSEKVFKVHTSGKYEAKRVPLLDSVKECLLRPDEIWLNDYKDAFANLNYIKFYKGKAVNVVCRINEISQAIEITTWFEIEGNPKNKSKNKSSRKLDPRWRYRRGLLIKK